MCDSLATNPPKTQVYPSSRAASTTPTLATRRSILAVLSTLLPAFVQVTLCSASDDEIKELRMDSPKRPTGKPFAAKGALLPAARLKTIVDGMYQLSLNLPKNSNDKQAQLQILNEMIQIWNDRTPLFRKNEKMPSKSLSPASAQLTTGVSSANKQQYQGLRQDLSIPDRMAAMLNQADVERQWGMLQYQEFKREQGNELRAALNFYTSQLEFGNSYLLTALPADRKRMIRNDALPSLTAVISADLDLRDLYRNDFLTAFEDVIAEINYQLKQQQSSSSSSQQEAQVDVADVVELMATAHAAIQKWFDLIPEADVQEAMQAIQNERETR